MLLRFETHGASFLLAERQKLPDLMAQFCERRVVDVFCLRLTTHVNIALRYIFAGRPCQGGRYIRPQCPRGSLPKNPCAGTDSAGAA
jgi:hypothetical protein